MERAGDQKKQEVILYIGDDHRYWSMLKERIVSIIGPRSIVYKMRTIKSFSKLYVDMLKVSILKPQIIYLDFTKNPKQVLMMAKLLRTLNGTKDIIVIALFDPSVDESLMADARSAGISITHVKGIEIHDVAYDGLVLMYRNENITCKFAMASTQKEIELQEPVRVRHITDDYIRIEGNISLDKGEELIFETKNLGRALACKRFTVFDSGNNGLYYDYLHWYKLTPSFLDPLLPPLEGSSETAEERRLKEKEWNDKRDELKESYKEWVDNNYRPDVQVEAKILIIDKKLRLVEHWQRTTSNRTFDVNYQQFLINPEEELSRMAPNLIIFGMDPRTQVPVGDSTEGTPGYLNDKAATNLPQNASMDLTLKSSTSKKEEEEDELTLFDKEEDESNLINSILPLMKTLPANDENSFDQMVQTIRRIPNYRPVIVILSDWPNHTSEYFIKRCNYKYILCDNGTFTFDKIIKYEGATQAFLVREEEKLLQKKLEELRKKDPRKYKWAKTKDIRDKMIVLTRTDLRSFSHIKIPVKLITISESEIEIESIKKLSLNSVYSLSIPTAIGITPISEEDRKGVFGHRCLIHSTGESAKSQLRQYVNDIFLEGKRRERIEEIKKTLAMDKEARSSKQGTEGKRTSGATSSSAPTKLASGGNKKAA